MTHRSIRRAFGLLTLLALTLSFGEAVWASVCPPMPSAEAAVADVAQAASDVADEHGQHAGACHFGSDSEGQEDGRCPLTPAATQGCAAAASLPASEVRAEVPLLRVAAAAMVTTTRDPLLLARSFFHPPRT